MNIVELHPEFGVQATDIDLSQPIGDAQWKEIERGMETHSVMLFRGQTLNDELQLALTRRFGVAEEEHVSYYSRGEIGYLGTVGNIDKEGNQLKNQSRSVRSGTGNEMWHSDSSFREVPSSYSLLAAYEVPLEGGDTEFVSTRSAYSRLTSEITERIDACIGIHDYIYSRTKVSEDAVTDGQRTFMYPVRQKLVRTNPVTGEKNFFIGSHVRDIEGWEHEEAQKTLQQLLSEATREESIYRHNWQAGDLLIWDNRCVLHRGCGYDADKYRRYMRQTRVRGSSPTLAE